MGKCFWINYLFGVIVVLFVFGLKVLEGFDYVVVFDLLMGVGLSSSVVIELVLGLVFFEVMV